MIVLEASSATELFHAAAGSVLACGEDSSPRGMPTREVLGAHLILSNPRNRLVHLPPARVLNPAFAVAEAMWIISGSDAPWIHDYNRNLINYTDNGVLHGAYGPRLRCWHGAVDQLDRVRQLLLTDPDSRRAVVQLFDPARDHDGNKDVPCTLGFRFFLRSGRLHMHTTMRSQDLWLGFPYDIFTFTLIQELMAGWLGAEVGLYQHSVDSLHLYDAHREAAADLPHPGPSTGMDPIAVAASDLSITLGRVIAGNTIPLPEPAWNTFAAVMASYRVWRGGDRHEARLLAQSVSGVLGESLVAWYDQLAAVRT